MPSITTNETSLLSTTVTVAPLVLLSVVDHYERIFNVNSSADNSSNKRVMGVILGNNSTKEITVTNSFAIPFEEDEKNPNIWFLDHNFIESMMAMFRKINAKEKLIGWYHSGPKLKSSDLQINELFKKFTPNPLLLIVDVKSKDIIDIPTDSYLAIEEIKDDGSNSEKTFIHIPSVIRAEEAEEIGVEHLLRDIRDQACGNLTVRLTNNFKSLKSLGERLNNIIQYLEKIMANELPINNTILAKLQEIFNYLPNMSNLAIPENSAMASKNHHLTAAFNVKTNDELMMVYVGSLIRSIISFHDLIENKSENKKEPDQTEDENPEEKESDVQEKESDS